MTNAERWRIYQRERFPVLAHSALILAFSSGAVCFSVQLRAAEAGERGVVALLSLLVAFATSFLFFFQLRVSDEHKDLEDDTRWRPYRPVPRGLVTLRELRNFAIAAVVVQAALALWLAPRLLVVLLVVWGYMWLMTREFWLHDFLRARPFTTLWSHMLVIPLIDLYATACDWMALPGGRLEFRAGLGWFLAASFFNGMVVEIGRKLRAPVDEEEGVETYTRVWGRARAVSGWLVVMLVSAGCAIVAASKVGGAIVVMTVLGALFVIAVATGGALVRAPLPGQGKRLEMVAGLWTIALYLTVGVIPFLRGRFA